MPIRQERVWGQRVVLVERGEKGCAVVRGAGLFPPTTHIQTSRCR